MQPRTVSTQKLKLCFGRRFDDKSFTGSAFYFGRRDGEHNDRVFTAARIS
jgi:hypothetical protein